MTEVSVIMPAYDAARFIGAAIDSILAEAPAALEVVVVDDGSRDDTHAIVERLSAADPRIRLIGQEHAGVSAARNKAVSSARGTFVAFLDADDL
ncbi:MAG: glycosyltransferase family 2 protein, partial [Rhizobiales bacterium]|nr:glycosyltransferase family 2 protein [Hyphomicrobiales bacterium]